MQESESLWSKDDLISEMEKMQAEIIDLKSQRKELNSEIQLLKSENRELLNQNEDLQTGNEELNQNINEKENLIQKISFEKLKLQSGIQDLTNELQIKSEAIVKMKGADLILKENEQLKEKDRKREIESNRRKEELEAEVRVVKEAFEESRDELECYKKLQKKRLAEYNQKINEQDRLIENRAKEITEKARSDLTKKFRNKQIGLDAEYMARIAANETRLWSIEIYAAIVTIFTAIQSKAFTDDIVSAAKTIGIIIKKLISFIETVSEVTAGLSDRINDTTLNLIVYWILKAITGAGIMAVPIVIIYLVGKKYISWYKSEIADSISVWVAVITLAVSIFFAEPIKSFLSINLIGMNIMVHLIYSGGRHYVRGCRKNRGYYYRM